MTVDGTTFGAAKRMAARSPGKVYVRSGPALVSMSPVNYVRLLFAIANRETVDLAQYGDQASGTIVDLPGSPEEAASTIERLAANETAKRAEST